MGEYLVDLRFQPHITIFRKNEMNVTEREQLGQSLEEFSTGQSGTSERQDRKSGSRRGVSTEPDVRVPPVRTTIIHEANQCNFRVQRENMKIKTFLSFLVFSGYKTLMDGCLAWT